MKKKVLHLQLLPLLSGVQRFSLHLLDGLPAEEYEISVACKPGGEFVSEIQKRGWNFIALPSFRHPVSPWDIVTFLHLIYLMRRHRFDIVHTNSSKPGLLGRIAATICGVSRVVHTGHGTPYLPHQAPLVYWSYLQIEKLANCFCDRVIYVNNTDRFKAIELGVIPAEKALTIYNAMKEKPVVDKRASNKELVTIGSTLRFSEQKNVLRLIPALCKAARQNDKLKFIILGDGKHLQLCRSIVASFRLSDRILLPGWDSEVAPWLKLFDVFILYSRWEAMPFSIIEAMYAGLPVIGSNIPSIAEFVNDKVGWTVPLDAEEALIETLISLPASPDTIKGKGKAALAWVKQISDYPAMIDAYRAVYEGKR
ncbi:MAG: glycosyltransferase [Candidatus Cloacimonetes bacterium]|jgi:glycosyltransferase involved in cell wall biosynthesis|nr:glycosyltransferase [Candidatus Cloacimonadota bacterium]